MNANQIINMVIRQVTRLAVNKGVNMGIKGASHAAGKMRKPKSTSTDDVYVDDFGNEVKGRDNRRS